MKRIDKWVSRDGEEWKTKEEAMHREYTLNRLESISSILPEYINTTSFANGHGYIQHNPKSVIRARNMLYELACEEFSSISQYEIKKYGFLRTIQDNNSPLTKLYSRLILCMDENLWREYGQGYFTNHPEKVEDVCLNAGDF